MSDDRFIRKKSCVLQAIEKFEDEKKNSFLMLNGEQVQCLYYEVGSWIFTDWEKSYSEELFVIKLKNIERPKVLLLFNCCYVDMDKFIKVYNEFSKNGYLLLITVGYFFNATHRLMTESLRMNDLPSREDLLY